MRRQGIMTRNSTRQSGCARRRLTPSIAQHWNKTRVVVEGVMALEAGGRRATGVGDGAGGCRPSLFCVISGEITLLSACVLTELTLIRKVALFRWVQDYLWRIMSIQMDLRRCRA